MIICPFCHFSNEEGSLFCEQCKSDLAGVPSAAASAPPPAPAAVEPIPVVPVEPIAAEPVVEAVPVEPIPVEPVSVKPLEPIPAAPVLEATPVQESAPQAPPVAPPPEPPLAPPPEAPVAAAPPPAPSPPPPAPAVAAPTGEDGTLPAGAQPRLLVLRGQKRNVEYPIYEGLNFIGRADEKPVDIDLEDQEPPDRIWCSRQHALISFEGNRLTLEDLNSSNGTYLNRNRVYPGQKQPLKVNDIIQIGNVQLKVII